MFVLEIPEKEYFDEANSEFIYQKGATLQLEHSLVSISKWESKWHKAFLGKGEKTPEEILDYIKCMTITKNVPDEIYERITQSSIQEIVNYIEDSMTATYFSEEQNKGHSRETPTSELIYYWMISLQIPIECQRWHLNRLLTLIRVCNVKNTPPKKMSKREIMNRNRSLNEARKAQYNTRG